MTEATQVSQPNSQKKASERRVPAFLKGANKVLAFLVKRNMGPKNVFILVTTTGRKSGKRFTTPIGYVRDGKDIVSFTITARGGASQWYKNILKNPQATLTLKGKEIEVKGTPVEGDSEILKVLAIYKKSRPQDMKRFFGVQPDGTDEELLHAKEKVLFVRWHPINKG
ncbi:MAG: nitroreductase family deazaflavin-dependent oxidoreductase [Chloroflexia bacterium]